MNPDRARHYVCIFVVLLTALAVRAQEIHPAPADCPQGDGYEWVKFTDHPSGKVMWLQTRTQLQFEQLCGRASACALRFEEVTVIVTQVPAWAIGESLRHHEECHDAWKHGAAPMASLLR